MTFGFWYNGHAVAEMKLRITVFFFLILLGAILWKDSLLYNVIPIRIFESRPVDSDAALRWDGDPILRGEPQWQKVDKLGQAFVYSAHYDDVQSPPLIRLIAIALDPLPFFFVTCRFFSHHDGPVIHNVSGTIFHFRHRNGRRYLGAYIECPAEDMTPYAVSVDKGNQDEALNYMVINYSQDTEWSDPVFQQFYSTEDEDSQEKNQPHSTSQPSWSGRDAQGWLWNVTRCFPAFQQGFDDHVMLAEMVAISRLLGVQHFVFYVQHAGPQVLAMLKVLEKQGDVEVHPWNMNIEEADLYYAGQFSSINDCLYRHLWTSRFLLFGDVDELFVQRDQASLMDLLEDEFMLNEECGAFLFLNVFFNLRLPKPALPAVNGTSSSRLQQLQMIGHTQRHTEVLPAGQRSKPAVDPRKVLTGSVHVIQTFRPGFEACVMEPHRGLLHHYREFSPVPPVEQQIHDPYLWTLYEEFVAEATFILDQYEENVSR